MRESEKYCSTKSHKEFFREKSRKKNLRKILREKKILRERE